MTPLSLEKSSSEEMIPLLLLGEILTRRGEMGPLARVWRPSPKQRRVTAARDDDRTSGKRNGSA